MTQSNIAVSMRGVCKQFGDVIALDNVDFELKEGEVHTLLGENGAGKSTLMNILYGLYEADKGELDIFGKRVILHSPTDAIKRGIGMVHQSFKLIPNFTLIDNIALTLQYRKEFKIGEVKKTVADLMKKYEIEQIDLDAEAEKLPAHEQQLVEILKMLCLGQKVLIWDEPTSVLAGDQIGKLLDRIRKLAEMGHSCIFISHKLEEVLKVSDRITVLRKGKITSHLEAKKANKNDLVQAMIGCNISAVVKPKVERGEEFIRVEGLTVLSDRGTKAVNSATFSVHKGEIVGIAGVVGNGQQELVEAITGIREAAAGKVFINGADVTNASPEKLIDLGVSYIPPKPKENGLALTLPIFENMMLRNYSNLFCAPLVNPASVQEYAKQVIEKYSISASSPTAPVRSMSGGNIMKLVVAREMARETKVFVIFDPTIGVDVMSIEFIHEQIVKARENRAVLLVSFDLDELLYLSDRLMVIYNGVVKEAGEGYTKEQVGLMITGAA